MSSDGIQAIRPEAREETVIDADFHVQVSVEDLLPYIEDDRILDKLASYGHPPHPSIWNPEYSYATNLGQGPGKAQGEAKTGEEVIEAIDDIGVDVPLVSTDFLTLPATLNPPIKTAICRAYNDYIIDSILDEDDAIKGYAMIPQWDPAAAVEELDRIGDEPDIVGAVGWYGPYKPLGAPEYDQLYETLVKLDLPLVLHGSGAFWPRFDPIGEGLRTWAEIISLSWPTYAMFYIANMVLTGVFEKYSDLTTVILEADVTWLPFLTHRLDNSYHGRPEDIQITERMFDMDETYLSRAPSEFILENFYFGTQPMALPDNSRHRKSMMELCDAENTFVFASDWPHFSFDVPNWVFTSSIDESVTKNIAHGNAQAAFRL